MSDKTELIKTIEELRAQKYSELPAQLVAQILTIEADFTDDRQEAHKRIAQLIERYIEEGL